MPRNDATWLGMASTTPQHDLNSMLRRRKKKGPGKPRKRISSKVSRASMGLPPKPEPEPEPAKLTLLPDPPPLPSNVEEMWPAGEEPYEVDAKKAEAQIIRLREDGARRHREADGRIRAAEEERDDLARQYADLKRRSTRRYAAPQNRARADARKQSKTFPIGTVILTAVAGTLIYHFWKSRQSGLTQNPITTTTTTVHHHHTTVNPTTVVEKLVERAVPGPRGASGRAGAPGARGRTGAPGKSSRGRRGRDGKNGRHGRNGRDGKSIKVAVDTRISECRPESNRRELLV